MKVWIVEQGDYSDRHVVAVFGSEERAGEFKRRFDRPYGECYVTGWELNEYNEVLDGHLRQWLVRMRCSDGAVAEVYESEVLSVHDNEPCLDIRRQFVMRCFARDAEHAVKIVNEKRTQAIALGDLYLKDDGSTQPYWCLRVE